MLPQRGAGTQLLVLTPKIVRSTGDIEQFHHDCMVQRDKCRHFRTAAGQAQHKFLHGTLPRSASQASSGVLCCATSFSVMSRLSGAPFKPAQTHCAIVTLSRPRASTAPLEARLHLNLIMQHFD